MNDSISSQIQCDKCLDKIRAIHDTMYVISGKWKVSIIACLCHRKMRYSEILRFINGLSGKVLSRELKTLETNSLIKRTVADTQPITVEYEITEYGKSLLPLTDAIAEWGMQHRKIMLEKE